MKTKDCILTIRFKIGVGVRLYFFWIPGGGGGGSLYLDFVRRGVIQNLDNG